MAEGHFVIKHQVELIQRVKNIAPILDELYSYNVLKGESYNEIMSIPDALGKMKALFSGPLKSSGLNGNEIFYKILKEHEPYLIADLKKRRTKRYKKVMDEVQEVTTTTLQVKLWETLNDLSYGEFQQFKGLLQHTDMKKGRRRIARRRLETAGRVGIVELMVEIYGQQSVEVTKEVLERMNRIDMVMKLSKLSSGIIEKQNSVRGHRPALSESEVTMTSVKEKLLKTLEDFSYGDLEKFKHVLLYTNMKESLLRIPRHQIERADKVRIVELMVEIYRQRSVAVTEEVLKKMNRNDLVQRLSDLSSGSKGPSRSLEHEGCGNTMQDSSDWTKLEPEVNSTDADEIPTYSLQSEAGNFECGVSGLRWFCKEKVSFKYQFCSWEEHMERMESIKYMPASPLIDITVRAGTFDEVYLPHWICIDDDPSLLDRFAVLHIDDCGAVVEKVSEVTPSHVKLSKPDFSPRAVLMKAGLPVRINCKVLIYKTNTAFLTLHVYLIPLDPGLQQAMDKRELSYGYNVIRKPHPEKSLKMSDRFILTADLDGAKISPEDLKLRYESRDPNFFEVYIENPDRNFTLSLAQKNEHQPVWIHDIRKDEYQSTGHEQETGGQSSIPNSSDTKPSVDEHLAALMQEAATITTDRERLLTMMGHLKQEELKRFKWFLQDSAILAGLPCIPNSQLEMGDMLDLVDLMLHTYSQRCGEVTKKVFKKINRNDLVLIYCQTSAQDPKLQDHQLENLF